MAFVAISVVPHAGKVRAWAEQHGLTGPIAVATGDVLTPLGLDGVPGLAVVDDGAVVAVARHGASADDIAAALAR